MRLLLCTCVVLLNLCCFAQNRKADGTIDSTYRHGIKEKADKLSWSYDGCLLFLSDEQGENWKVVKAFDDIYIMGIYPVDDNTVILWDAHSLSYFRYSLKDNRTTPYRYDQPLKKFLKYPVKSIRLSEHFASCVSDTRDILQYSLCGDNKYCPQFYAVNVNDGQVKERDIVAFSREPQSIDWQAILSNINNDHSKLPAVADLGFTDADINRYLAMVDSMEGQTRDRVGFLRRGTFVIDTPFYRNIIYSLDTLKPKTLISSLKFSDTWRTSADLFQVHLVNEQNDTLIIQHMNWGEYRTLFLPWTIKYKGLEFYSYDVQLSRNIAKLLPGKQRFNKLFDKSDMLLSIADYLYDLKIRTDADR